MNRTDYQCIIIGAGPGGARAAYELSKTQKEILIIDYKDNLGDKLCTGIIGINCVNEFGLDKKLIYMMLDFLYFGNDEQKNYGEARCGLLTPVSKSWISDLSVELTSMAIQIYGGMGYVEETGVAQYFRDARIFHLIFFTPPT